ncbi:hypothetical protein BDY21DRAFT_128921 [Lineolata rhizophorae]|uniref:Uncharacterized protein n=1 Tax=Lineolata rhizophorae TaxID=578093 RepID=A0A6A6NPL4_9PEZI|nr:hypothetical protein BDY21DRAFT_128921 [Lineolata rhizophorae]
MDAAVRCGAVRCGAVRCGAVRCDDDEGDVVDHAEAGMEGEEPPRCRYALARFRSLFFCFWFFILKTLKRYCRFLRFTCSASEGQGKHLPIHTCNSILAAKGGREPAWSGRWGTWNARGTCFVGLLVQWKKDEAGPSSLGDLVPLVEGYYCRLFPCLIPWRSSAIPGVDRSDRTCTPFPSTKH